MPSPSRKNSLVTSPTGPSVAMKAKASGMPAKFDATPLKVVTIGRRNARHAPHHHGPRQQGADESAQQRRCEAELDAGL